MSDISLVVGDTNGFRPKPATVRTSGWLSSITDALTRVERGVSVLHFTDERNISTTSSLVCASVVRISTTHLHSGVWHCVASRH